MNGLGIPRIPDINTHIDCRAAMKIVALCLPYPVEKNTHGLCRKTVSENDKM